MRADTPHILLVGRSFTPGSQFFERLCRSGCACQIANSLEDARAAVRARTFDLVLSEMGLPDGSAFPLMALLERTKTTLYFCVGVHDGCWWLPALERGRRVWGEAALRPAEFARALAELLGTDALHAAASAPAANVIPIPVLPSVETAKPERAATEDERRARKSSA
ncbi:MAG: hypothetical protein HY234_01545 [Acidobacteria bacterium]|nr:hypothetical protein [Acidobacteriota bacterium]